MPANSLTSSEEIAKDMAQRSHAALVERRLRGEIMTYVIDDWVVREYPGQRVVRLCPLDEFKAADYPEPPLAK